MGVLEFALPLPHKRRLKRHQERVVCVRIKVVQSEVEDQKENK